MFEQTNCITRMVKLASRSEWLRCAVNYRENDQFAHEKMRPDMWNRSNYLLFERDCSLPYTNGYRFEAVFRFCLNRGIRSCVDKYRKKKCKDCCRQPASAATPHYFKEYVHLPKESCIVQYSGNYKNISHEKMYCSYTLESLHNSSHYSSFLIYSKLSLLPIILSFISNTFINISLN